MTLDEMIERLTYLRDTGYASGFEQVIAGDANETVQFQIEDIETDGGQIVVKVV